jgi:2-keto-4-pentenoate hydratase/2-oxohepta-3-ene-1,7-dioic acid hydratase in catechol pathway
MPQQETPILHIKCQSLLVNMNNETQNHHNTGDLVFWMPLLTCWISKSIIVPGTLMLCGTAGLVGDVTGISP